MPSVSQKQQEFFGMVDAGKIPRPKGMNAQQVKEFARTERKGLPYRARSGKKSRRHRIAMIRAKGTK